MNNLIQNYEIILKELTKTCSHIESFSQVRQPKLSSLELVALNLTAEYMSIDSEYQLFRMLPKKLYDLIERSVYNRRRRKLFFHRQRLQKMIASKISSSDYYIVDSMSLEVCKLSRSDLSRICKENLATSPNIRILFKTETQLLWLQITRGLQC